MVFFLVIIDEGKGMEINGDNHTLRQFSLEKHSVIYCEKYDNCDRNYRLTAETLRVCNYRSMVIRRDAHM